LNGKDVYLGRYQSPESIAEYQRRISEWLINGGRSPGRSSDLTINEMLLAYLRFADGYYRKHGEPTKEPALLRLSFRTLRQLYGDTLASEFGPLALKATRQAMIDAGLSRLEINRRVGRIGRAFKWAVENEMVPASIHHGLKAVAGLKKGRTEAKELEPVRPVPDAFVDAIRPFVPPQIWAMVELMRLSGMRPQEVCMMRTCDVNTQGRIWEYRPESHKTEHHGKSRVIFIGPQGQAVLKPWLRTELGAYLFSPAEAMAERRAEWRRNRKSKVQPSQRDRRKARPKRKPGDRYDTRSLYHAVAYGIRKAQTAAKQAGERPIPDWHPNQLRHNAATRLRREFGLDVARAVLGHSSPVVTEVYAELDGAKAAEAMERVG
jgi:integrase